MGIRLFICFQMYLVTLFRKIKILYLLGCADARSLRNKFGLAIKLEALLLVLLET